MRVVVRLGSRDFLDAARESLGFFQGLVRPYARVDVVGLAVFVEQVHRDHAELERCATPQIDDFVVFGNAHQFAKRRVRVFDHSFDSRSAVADFKNAHAGICKVCNRLGGFLGGLFRQRGGSGAEIIDCLAHGIVLSKLVLKGCSNVEKGSLLTSVPFWFSFFEGFDGRLVFLEAKLCLEFAAFLAVDVLVFEEDVQDGRFRLGGDRIGL